MLRFIDMLLNMVMPKHVGFLGMSLAGASLGLQAIGVGAGLLGSRKRPKLPPIPKMQTSLGAGQRGLIDQAFAPQIASIRRQQQQAERGTVGALAGRGLGGSPQALTAAATQARQTFAPALEGVLSKRAMAVINQINFQNQQKLQRAGLEQTQAVQQFQLGDRRSDVLGFVGNLVTTLGLQRSEQDFLKELLDKYPDLNIDINPRTGVQDPTDLATKHI